MGMCLCSPFGICVLQTSCGGLVCETADEAVQMLLSTMSDLSNAVDVRPGYIMAEHMMPRYEAAVAAHVLDTQSETKKWSTLVREASTWELRMYKVLNEHSRPLNKALRCGPLHSVTRRSHCFPVPKSSLYG